MSCTYSTFVNILLFILNIYIMSILMGKEFLLKQGWYVELVQLLSVGEFQAWKSPHRSLYRELLERRDVDVHCTQIICSKLTILDNTTKYVHATRLKQQNINPQLDSDE